MSKQNQNITLEELPGDHHLCLEDAQNKAKHHIAHALVISMRGMLTDGLLVIRDGKIIPNLDK